MAEFKQSVVNIAEICAQKGVTHAILSPGSRSAPLTLAFLRHSKMTCRTIVDERSAGFVALGIAQQSQRPVVLVCTSGTAALNYGPAIAEAFYQHIPLIVFTADRPPEWIDQNDGQTIRQIDLYSNYCRASFVLPVDASHPDACWHSTRLISDAINISQRPTAGPVHVNVPLREPLYPNPDFEYDKKCKIIADTPVNPVLSREVWQEFTSAWKKAKRKLIVAGMHKPNDPLVASLQKLGRDETTTVVCDVTSNAHNSQSIHYSDMILGTEDKSIQSRLKPELLLTFGGPVVSKNMKLFLRKNKPDAHWHLQSSTHAVDTFQALTRTIPVSAESFFENLLQRVVIKGTTETDSYSEMWRALDRKAQGAMHGFLSDVPHCEFSAMKTILSHLPERSHLQLGNSFVVRLANFIGLAETCHIEVHSNRGTSGIDGTLATAVGAALATRKITTIVLGDLAFFYDRNALWHDHVPPNLRVIILNNAGGGIFRLIDGPAQLPELRQHFEAEHNLTAERSAEDHGLDYTSCETSEQLKQCLTTFFEPGHKPAILEIHTDKDRNVETFCRFKKIMKEIK
ncbi:MAG: 2-succinyl-5-enolpyruvyl-6-hydroxy-3-cyclohexene-1-carboxylic-acid synthase [bacterium]